MLLVVFMFGYQGCGIGAQALAKNLQMHSRDLGS